MPAQQLISMPETSRPALAEIVTRFTLAHAEAPDIFRRLELFVASLSSDPSWSADEVAEIHNRLIERLTA
jgi:hypothetical protein